MPDGQRLPARDSASDEYARQLSVQVTLWPGHAEGVTMAACGESCRQRRHAKTDAVTDTVEKKIFEAPPSKID